MLYNLIKLPARLAIFLHCRRLNISDKRIFNDPGPLLIASNHPNSFLDAIIVATLFKKPVYSLARGDVFRNRFAGRLLRKLNMLPVYRLSEGANNLSENFSTFAACRDIFKKDGIVLIFSEGLCINEWHLRDLKKGTARLALESWNEGIPLRVLPMGINYQSFSSFGKNVIIKTGPVIRKGDIDTELGKPAAIAAFNTLLKKELQQLVIEIPDRDPEKIREIFRVKISAAEKTLLFLPALAGYLLHAPLYLPFRKFIYKKAGMTGHFDSIMTGGLFILYPFYLALITLCAYLLSCNVLALVLLPSMPLLAYACIRLKKQF